MGMYNVDDYGVKPREADLHAEEHGHGNITDWIEMWDYVGGIRFRGFVAEKKDEKAMFVFFDQSVVVGDLKAG